MSSAGFLYTRRIEMYSIVQVDHSERRITIRDCDLCGFQLYARSGPMMGLRLCSTESSKPVRNDRSVRIATAAGKFKIALQ